MRVGWIVGLVAMVGCGGDDETTTCEEAEVVLTVTDEAGEPVSEATVEVGDATCTEGDPGVYTCTVPPGEHVASVVLVPDFNPWAQTLVIEEGECTFPVAVELPPPLVY